MTGEKVETVNKARLDLFPRTTHHSFSSTDEPTLSEIGNSIKVTIRIIHLRKNLKMKSAATSKRCVLETHSDNYPGKHDNRHSFLASPNP